MVLANPEKGERIITLGDEDFVMKFGASSIIMLEDRLNLPTGEIQRQLAQGSITVLRELIFVGSRKHHKKDFESPVDVNPYLDEVEDLSGLLKPLMEAFQAGYPGVSSMDELYEEPEPEPRPKKTRAKRKPAAVKEEETEEGASS